MTYEELLETADTEGLIVKEKLLIGSNGRIYKNRIAIRSDIQTTAEKSCTLAEEIGHYKTTYGDITRLDNISNEKQEYRARLYGYNLQVGLIGIIKCYEHGCRNLHEMAELLDVTEGYLDRVISVYRQKYGMYATLDNYIIYFEPCLTVMKIK